MRIVIAGGHGKIARLLGEQLAGRGDEVRGLIRNPDQADQLRERGIEPRVTDLEQTSAAALAEELTGADAAVFAAGAGPGSGIARKETVDHSASRLLADACERAGVRRLVQISSMGTSGPNPVDVSEVFGAYLDAKRAAEQDLRSRDLDWTILRPGRLTDDAATGRVQLDTDVARAEVARADVAAVCCALLDEPRTGGLALELVNGGTPVAEAVRAVLG